MVSRIRFGHFSPDTPAVDLLVEGELIFENLGFEDITEFVEFEDGRYLVEVKSSETEEKIVEADIELLEEINHTVIFSGLIEDERLRPVIVEDRFGAF